MTKTDLRLRIRLMTKALAEQKEIVFWHKERCYTILRAKGGSHWNCYRGNVCLDKLKDPNAPMTDYRKFEDAWAAIEEAIKENRS